MSSSSFNSVNDIYKTIMCPLKEKCKNDNRPRWPKSATFNFQQMGETCPYAHHVSELKFPETLSTRIMAIDNMKKNALKEVDNKNVKKPFIPASNLTDCKYTADSSCHCNICKHRFAAKENERSHSIKSKKYYNIMKGREDAVITEYMKDIEALKNDTETKNRFLITDDFCKKFGYLKKACILYYYGRDKEAKRELAFAGKIVQKEMERDSLRTEAIQKRWKFKLGLDEGFELPETVKLDKFLPENISDAELKSGDHQGV